MKPSHLYGAYVMPAMDLLATISNQRIRPSREADVLLMAIAGQESGWAARVQNGGPARSYWQFELGGGVIGVITHPSTSQIAAEMFNVLDIKPPKSMTLVETVYDAMAWNDTLAACMARLLLFTDPSPLPKVGDKMGGWSYYTRNWRPGAPHGAMWADRYNTAVYMVPGP